MALKSQRKRLQRQLEFYLSESNVRQDKYLQQNMDDEGFLPISLFLSFNRLKAMKATERLILEAAEKSNVIRADSARMMIAPAELPFDKEDLSDEQTIYLEGFDPTHDHDSLRKIFASFGKINLVSMPRFQQSRKFKGFAFVEFASQEAAQAALEAIKSGATSELQGMKAMSKVTWQEMKEKLKAQLNAQSPEEATTPTKGTDDLEASAYSHSHQAQSGHIHFRDDDGHEIGEDAVREERQAKKQRTESP
ncbi:hypothetical protein Poli38472_008956 [Pythium oligandrum]|uniref:La-related protein 7 n=1 Tax=Pythium oligandrum TaxID=41045 RepID=A0A8K1FEZ3_PYTOL|nr:hypothetical protein Poli38472_008956 [Pythium oligandrum]|eukprot:TMW56308.1 hypothetical protein Poli38472_008956 [Pythium oligandrum]